MEQFYLKMFLRAYRIDSVDALIGKVLPFNTNYYKQYTYNYLVESLFNNNWYMYTTTYKEVCD